MKKISFLLLAMFVTLAAAAQEYAPATTIEVTLRVKREQVVMGPYSRYSEQYIGVKGPLNNRTTYTVVGASMSERNAGGSAGSSAVDLPTQGIEFPDVSTMPVSTGRAERSTAELAKAAADNIFTLRKRRFEMVTGESIDLGAGTEAAIKEMQRLEESYLELFTGKRSVDYFEYTFHLIPTKDKERYTICRFSENTGIVSDTDITADPVSVTIKSLKTLPEPKKAPKGGKLTPEIMECSLFLNMDKILTDYLPMNQYGKVL